MLNSEHQNKYVKNMHQEVIDGSIIAWNAVAAPFLCLVILAGAQCFGSYPENFSLKTKKVYTSKFKTKLMFV